jgi:hypothetical protein
MSLRNPRPTLKNALLDNRGPLRFCLRSYDWDKVHTPGHNYQPTRTFVTGVQALKVDTANWARTMIWVTFRPPPRREIILVFNTLCWKNDTWAGASRSVSTGPDSWHA